MAIKKNAKKTVSKKKPAPKASQKKNTQKKGKTARKGAAIVPDSKVSGKKIQSKKRISTRDGAEKNAARNDRWSSYTGDSDDMTRVDDVAAYNDDQPSPQDEDAEASAYATGGDDEAEVEARDLDLEEVAEAAQLADRQTTDDADLPDADDIDDAMGIDDVMPLPAIGYGDDFDVDDMMAMSAFQSRSVLGAEERNAVIQEVKQRAEKNGGYVTYDELNQIVPATVQDESTADEYLLILQALNVDVIRAEDVEAYRANKDRQGDSRLHAARVQEMFDDPIRMYLHQMGQVPLLTREQEVDICMRIEESEAKTKDLFNRFAFTPDLYAGLLEKLESMQERFDRVVTDRFDENRDA